MSTIPFIIIAVTLSVAGQLFVKKGINLVGNLEFSSGLFATYLKLFISPYVILGVLIYFSSVFFWLYALTKVDLSYAVPFLALTYVLIIIASWMFLGETIPFIRWVGVMIICLGLYLISKS